MASSRHALTEAPQRITKPHWSRPVNSGPRPCLFDVGFPLSGLQDRTSTSDLSIVPAHPRRLALRARPPRRRSLSHPVVGRTHGHQRGEKMAAGGENRWPYLGRNRWPLTQRSISAETLARSASARSRACATTGKSRSRDRVRAALCSKRDPIASRSRVDAPPSPRASSSICCSLEPARRCFRSAGPRQERFGLRAVVARLVPSERPRPSRRDDCIQGASGSWRKVPPHGSCSLRPRRRRAP